MKVVTFLPLPQWFLSLHLQDYKRYKILIFKPKVGPMKMCAEYKFNRIKKASERGKEVRHSFIEHLFIEPIWYARPYSSSGDTVVAKPDKNLIFKV